MEERISTELSRIVNGKILTNSKIFSITFPSLFESPTLILLNPFVLRFSEVAKCRSLAKLHGNELFEAYDSGDGKFISKSLRMEILYTDGYKKVYENSRITIDYHRRLLYGELSSHEQIIKLSTFDTGSLTKAAR